MEFSFTCADPVYDNQLWKLYRALAKGRIFVVIAYWGTKHAYLINAKGYKGSKSVPALYTKAGPSINWHITNHGRLRIDGTLEQHELIAAALRQRFEEFDQARSRHAIFTGRRGAAPVSTSLTLNKMRSEWAQTGSNRVLVINRCQICDPLGTEGPWDAFHASAGTKITTTNATIPWIIMTSTRVGISAHANGSVRLQIGNATLDAVKVTEDILVNRFGGQWISEDEPRPPQTSVVSYGTPSAAALEAKAALGRSLFR